MRIKNWEKFQHFKDRRPPWIKLYRDLLDDPDWHELDPDLSKTLVMLWLIASEDEGKEGKLPCIRKLAFRLRQTEQEIKQQLMKLEQWIDINMISDGYQDDAPETETETETEKDQRGASPDLFLKPSKKRYDSLLNQDIVQQVNDLCNKITISPKIFNPRAFIQKQLASKKWTVHPKGLIDTLTQVVNYQESIKGGVENGTIKSAYQYVQGIFARKNQNACEKDAISEHEIYKAELKRLAKLFSQS